MHVLTFKTAMTFMAQAPQKEKVLLRALHVVDVLVTTQQQGTLKPLTTGPGQGLNCSQVISRKGSNSHREQSTCVLLADTWCKRSRTQRTDQLNIVKMQGDSGETQYTFDGNTAAPAGGVSQSSPGTADSGDKSTRTTRSGWQMTHKHRRSMTTSSPRSASDATRSGNARRGHRSPRRTPTRPRTPRAVEDQPGRGSSDISAKRKSTEARGSNEPIAIIE